MDSRHEKTALPPPIPPSQVNLSMDHLQEPITFPGEESSAIPSTSTTVAAIKAYSEHIVVNIVINNDFVLNKVALFDTGADSNCIVKGLVPTRYLQKSTSRLELPGPTWTPTKN